MVMFSRIFLSIVGSLVLLSGNSLAVDKRAAIVIAGGGSESSNALWDTTYAISNSTYSSLVRRGFSNDEIYYLSPVDWVDFNGDGISDRIVDAPNTGKQLNSTDIQISFDWANKIGKLDQPLYIFFVGHGGVDKLQLSKDNTLPVEQFKQMLDDYQTTTGNELVLVIDASFSGVLGKKLVANKRAIISSADNGYAYFNRTSKQGFSSFLMNGLSKGMTFNEAFSYATTEQNKLLSTFNQISLVGTSIEQLPQKYDQNQLYTLDKLLLNGSFFAGGDTYLQIQLNQTSYTVGHTIRATITEDLSQGYDLYLAVILPSGDFLTLKDKNTFSSINVPESWQSNRQQGVANTFLDLSLPSLPTGQYCLFGILSPEGEPPLNAQKYWKQTTQCFTLN
jgi:hypothetical protein